MGIRFLCPRCGKKIHVKDFLAGKRGICPKCDAGVDIPLVSQFPTGRKKKSRTRPDGASPADDAVEDAVDHVASTAARPPQGRLLGGTEMPTADPLVECPRRSWFVGAADGRDVGPLAAGDIRQMIDAGDIRAETSVRRDDWLEPMTATAVWPHWQGADPFAAPAPRVRPEPGPAEAAETDSATRIAGEPFPPEPSAVPPSPPSPGAPEAFDSPTIFLPPAAIPVAHFGPGGQASPPGSARPVAPSSASAPYAGAPLAATPYQTSPYQTSPYQTSHFQSSPHGAASQPPYAAAPISTYAPTPDSGPPADSAAPEPELYYSRGSNASYVAAILILIMVVAVLAVAAYRVVVDPPAWLRPPQSQADPPGRLLQTCLPFLPRNES